MRTVDICCAVGRWRRPTQHEILRANGADMSDVVSVTVYVTDIDVLDQITDIRMKYFPSNGPASAIVEISRLAIPELLIEISAVATAP